MNELANHELSTAGIPGPGSGWDRIVEFAHTFNGYKAWGSFEKCAEVANARRGETLTELRTCLFFEARRWRHMGEDPEGSAMDYISRMLSSIRDKVAAKEFS